MNRLLRLALLALLIFSTTVTTEAEGWRFWKRSKTKEATVEATAIGPVRATTGAKLERKESEERREGAAFGPTQTITLENATAPVSAGKPVERKLTKASSRVFDVRRMPAKPRKEKERPEREGPTPAPSIIETLGVTPESKVFEVPPLFSAAAPAPTLTFDGLDRFNWGSGSPPDTNGDAGPTYYIQSVNSSVGIYRKSDGFQEAAFTFDTLMSQGNFGNQCDTENFGDPVVLYDTFEDRWVLTDFAFTLDGGGNVNPPIAFQCFAVSMNGNPLTGGWNFYSISVTDGLNDYPKLGVWTDGIYMSANVFGYAAGGSFQTARAWAFNKAQMYAGAPTVQAVSFNVPGGDFTVVPSNARLQTGTPPAGRPNLFVSSWQFLNALTVYKFHVDWNSLALSTFTGPDAPLAATSWPNAAVGNAPQSGTATLIDVLQIRAMVQNQYTKFGATESLWVPHTVRRVNTTGFAAPRWYQVDVTGGTVAANMPQAATWDPDGANTNHRFMPSLALDRAGNMALGYSISSSTTFPSIAYAGRLVGDPVNTFSQTEQVLLTGTASQTTSSRWGDYSSMTLDPDGCTFWYTTEYANPASQATNQRWLTRIGRFTYPSCTPVGAGGTLTGTVTALTGGAPISGATIQFGARSTTTDGSGVYSFTGIPAGDYPSETASKPGFITGSASPITITDGGTTTQNFALADAPASACLTDTTQADFQTGVATNADLTASAGDVVLSSADTIDQQNGTLGTSGVGITVTTFGGQTFTPSVAGTITRVDVNLFCSGCSGTIPNLTLSIRATAGGLPTGADLASATIAGFNSGASAYYTANFGAPLAVTAGTQYAFVIRPTANPAPGTYALTRSGTATTGSDVYAGGTRCSGATSGTVWSIPLTGGISTDAGFRVFLDTGFAPSGNLVSSAKDSNPAVGLTPIWSTMSWNASTPANTSLQFQVAGSNSATGPFNFIGPDGTAGTFFTTSPVSLSQFYGLRYLKYKAYLATTDSAVTSTLNDVTLCFNDVDCSAPIAITPTPATVCENSTGNTASGPAGATSYSWSITNGTITSATNIQSITYTAGASGSVGLTLNIVEASGCQKSDTENVTIVTVATPTITPGGPTTFCTGGSVTLTSSSASGNQWYLNGNPIGGETNPTYVATASGDYTVVVTTSGCSSAASSTTTVTVNPAPPTPTITPGGPTTFCAGGSVTLTSSSATGNQWYLDGNPIGGEINQTYVATASGSYTVVVTASGCSSAPSAATVVTVNPIPATPTITPGGPTTFCTGGSVTLTSSSATGNQWYLNGNPIGGETNQSYVATASGDYTVVTTASGCSSAASSTTTVTVNPVPATPTITPGGPTTFCAGGSVLLTSSSASGNQWYVNGNPIGGETNQTYSATTAGDYTVVVTTSGCPSAASTATTVTINPLPNATITAPGSVGPGSTGNAASVANAGVGATYAWGITNGTITGGTGTSSITFTAGVPGTVALNVTVTTAAGCSDAQSANVTVTAIPTVTVTSVTPNNGTRLGGTAVAIGGTNFAAGATVTFGGNAATSVVVSNSTTITASTPAHIAGQVNVTVTNTDTSTGTLTNGYTYNARRFDPNNDNMVDPSDIFYLINYLFTNGPVPAGTAGMMSGDANGDSIVDPSDIFFAVNYLFSLGAEPESFEQGNAKPEPASGRFEGSISLGQVRQKNGRFVVPVIVTMKAGSILPRAISLDVRVDGGTSITGAHRADGIATSFEISRQRGQGIAYLASFSEASQLQLDKNGSVTIAELELDSAEQSRLEINSALTMLVDGQGTRKATVKDGTLTVKGIDVGRAVTPKTKTQGQ